MAANNTAEIGFEKKIWDAACILRGNLDAAEYKHVIQGRIFLKYISDKNYYTRIMVSERSKSRLMEGLK